MLGKEEQAGPHHCACCSPRTVFIHVHIMHIFLYSPCSNFLVLKNTEDCDKEMSLNKNNSKLWHLPTILGVHFRRLRQGSNSPIFESHGFTAKGHLVSHPS